MSPATYILPIKSDHGPDGELTEYLRGVSERCELIVVDGSGAAAFSAAHAAWSPFARHVAPDDLPACANGKVRGVLTGLRLARTDRAVIADDDVRYAPDNLERIIAELDGADVVAPQNYFDPAPWHARWDSARTLINRVTGGDFPGTLGVRLALMDGGYDGDVLFENLELMRTVEARGGTCRRLPDLYVRRRPPTTTHFLGQRVRQAYDEFGRPARLALWLALLPALMLVGRHRRRTWADVAIAAVVVAEAGRRRAGGRRYFSPAAAAMAPLWVAERAICVWLAVAMRLRGGVPYAGGRIARAATPRSELHARAAVRR